MAEASSYTKSPAFQYYPASFEQSTAAFTLAEVGAYQRLLNYQWCNGSVPGDSIKALSMILRCTPNAAKTVWATIAAKFVRGDDGGWRNARLEQERVKQEEFRQRQSDRGKAGAERRWLSSGDGASNGASIADPLQPDDGSLSLSSSLNTSTEGFEEFWLRYPRKTGKEAARRAWSKIKPNSAVRAEMLDALGWQSRSPQWVKDGGQFVPHPATWLNQGRWQDEPQGDSSQQPDSSSALVEETRRRYLSTR